MSRFRRILLHAATFLSLAAAILLSILWKRSYIGSDYVCRTSPSTTNQYGSVVNTWHYATWTAGRIRLYKEVNHYYPRGEHPEVLVKVPPRPVTWHTGNFPPRSMGNEPLHIDSFWNRLGFHTYTRGMSTSWSDETEEGIAIPAALPAILFAIPPVLWLRALVRTLRRRQNNHCALCGYDLRHSPTRCPECGAARVGTLAPRSPR